MGLRYLLALSDLDPVARAVGERWGTRATVGQLADGTAVRGLDRGVGFVRRPGHHVLDEGLAALIPEALLAREAPIVFPSIHRSEQGVTCLTVHPLGNLGVEAEVGGLPGRLTPTAPRLMTDALRRLAEAGGPLGLTATFEATHHGPWLARPAFFAEIGFGDAPSPPADAVAALAAVLPALEEDPRDRVALGVGGGHYVPHLTELALERRWAFGHLVSRHGLARATRATLVEALALTPGAEGIVYARAADAEDPKIAGLGPRRRDNEAPRRSAGSTPSPATGASPPSGT